MFEKIYNLEHLITTMDLFSEENIFFYEQMIREADNQKLCLFFTLFNLIYRNACVRSFISLTAIRIIHMIVLYFFDVLRARLEQLIYIYIPI